MSGQLRIDTASRLKTSSLVERLQAIGVCVPDQADVQRMKRAMLLGLPLTASKFRIQTAFLRMLLLTMNAKFYRVFTWDAFVKYEAPNFGGYPPPAVLATAEKIRQFLPDVELRVHATFDDPWLEVCDSAGSVIIHGWLRASRYEPAVQVL